MSDPIHIQRNAPEQDIVERGGVEVRASSVDEATRSVELVLATENPVFVKDKQGRVVQQVLRMDGIRAPLPEQIGLLSDHGKPLVDGTIPNERIRGSIRNLRIEGGALVVRAYFATDQASDAAWVKVRDGHLRSFSVGAAALNRTRVEPGETKVVLGRSHTAGRYALEIVDDWFPREGSIVTFGADPDALTRADITNPLTDSTPTKDPAMKFADWLRAKGFDPDTITAVQRAALEASFTAEQAAAATVQRTVVAPPAAGEGDEAARAANIARTRAIRAAGEGLPPELVNRACDEGWDIARANQEFLAEIRRTRGATSTGNAGVGVERVEVTAAGEDKLVRSIETSLLLRSGRPVTDQALVREAADMRRAGIQDIARACVEGARMRAPLDPDQLLQRAISTVTFPVALGNTLNRQLQMGYEAYPSTLMQWAGRRNVRDFREHKNIRLGNFNKPVKVGKGGEVPHAKTVEEAEGYSAATYGQQFVFTREDFINDDLGLFDRTPFNLGQSMRMNIDDIGYTLLISGAGLGPTLDSDSVAVFNASRGDGSNYQTGATTTLTGVGLTALKLLMRKLKDNGREVNIRPRFLLVPPELEQAALELVTASTVMGSTTADALKPNVNVHQGTLVVIVEPRLSAGTNGTTAWYLIAEQVQAESLAVCFLRGQESPTVERVTMQSPLAMGWLAYHDVGVDAIGWRGIARSKGAA